MASNPYSKYGSLEEYNIGGDAGNGRKGSYSSGAIANRAVQQNGQKSANPYAEILNYLPQKPMAAASQWRPSGPVQQSTNPDGSIKVVSAPDYGPGTFNDYVVPQNYGPVIAQEEPQPIVVSGPRMATSVGTAEGGTSPYVDSTLAGPTKTGSYTDEQLYGTYGPNGEYIPPNTTTVEQPGIPVGGNKNIDNGVENPLAPGAGGDGNGTVGGGPAGGGGGTDPVTPLPGPQIPKPPEPPAGGGEYTASNGNKYPIPPVPASVNPQLWHDVTGYVTEAGLQGHDYSWLWTHPNAVQEFRAWAVANPNRAKDVDIVDWLRHNYGAAQGIQATHGLAGRRGYDTYVFSPAGVPWGHGLDGTGGQGINPTPQAPPPNSTDANGVPLPPGYRAPSDPNATGPNGGPGTQPAPPGTPGAPPTLGGPNDWVVPKTVGTGDPTIPVEENEQKFIAGGGPDGGKDFKTPEMKPEWAGEFNPNANDTFKRYEDLFNPMFQRQQDQFARKMRAQGALTGNIDSGGFGQDMAEGLAELGGQQSALLGDKISTAHEKALDRVLQKYVTDTGAKTAMHQIDTQKFIAQLQDDTAKYGIKTNADLERYLGDKKLELERYGIDANDLLERYKADTAARVGMYSADRGVEAASLQASAAGAAASANAAAAQYDAQVRRELGLIGFDIERENNIMRFILGLGSLGGDYMDNIIGTSPDWWLNNNPWPGGDTYVKP
jgi:hypothetical protein